MYYFFYFNKDLRGFIKYKIYKVLVIMYNEEIKINENKIKDLCNY